MSRIGTRRAIVFGLTSTSLFTLAFGLAPDICSPSASLLGLELLFFLFYFLNGLTGALAETASIALVASRFQARLPLPETKVFCFHTLSIPHSLTANPDRTPKALTNPSPPPTPPHPHPHPHPPPPPAPRLLLASSSPPPR